MSDKKCNIFQSTYLGDNNWGNMWKTIQAGKQPFKYMDRLEIAFADINADDPDNAFLIYTGEKSNRAVETVAEAKKENPSIEIISQMNWASYLAPLVEDQSKVAERLDTFAKSIPGFLNQYGLHGIDFDWESIPENMTTDNATLLFKLTKQYLTAGGFDIMTITPATTESLDIGVVNELFSAVIAQSYYENPGVDSYLQAGIKSSILYCGINSEPPPGSCPPNGDISAFIAKLEQCNLPGLYSWRVDNDDTDMNLNVPRYTITSSMWEYSRGVRPEPPLYP